MKTGGSGTFGFEACPEPHEGPECLVGDLAGSRGGNGSLGSLPVKGVLEARVERNCPAGVMFRSLLFCRVASGAQDLPHNCVGIPPFY